MHLAKFIMGFDFLSQIVYILKILNVNGIIILTISNVMPEYQGLFPIGQIFCQNASLCNLV